MDIYLCCFFSLTRIKQERTRATIIENNIDGLASQGTITLNTTETSQNQSENSFNNIMSTEFCLYVQATLLALVFFLGIAR